MNAITGIVRLASTLACLIVIVSFAMWAADKGETASQAQIAELQDSGNGQYAPAAQSEESQREEQGDGARELINDTADVLTRPFDGVAESSTNEWVQHGMPALLALLAYGLLLRLLLNYLPVIRR